MLRHRGPQTSTAPLVHARALRVSWVNLCEEKQALNTQAGTTNEVRLTILPRIVQKQQNKNIAMKGIFIMELSNTLGKC